MLNTKSLKNDHNFFWTNHAKFKLLQYGLSPTAVRGVVRQPERIEVGVAPETTAVMRRKDTAKNKREVWVMYQKTAKSERLKMKNVGKIKIISTWIYPGVSPKGKEIFIPEDVWKELEEKEEE